MLNGHNKTGIAGDANIYKESESPTFLIESDERQSF
jgi:hypothetical protein